MQTFLPYADFAQTASVLDNKRLGKQRVENLQLVLALCRINLDGSPKTGRTWADHPIGRMWSLDHLHSLYDYQFAICHEWTDVRGFKDTCLDKTFAAIERHDTFTALGCAIAEAPAMSRPWWIGRDGFHRAHQSNLVRKDPVFYTPLFPDVPNNLAYHWPAADAVPYELMDQPSPFLPVMRAR